MPTTSQQDEQPSLACSANEGPAPDLLPGPHVVAGPDDAILQVGFCSHGGAGEQDAPLYGRSGPYPAPAPGGKVSRQGKPRPILSDSTIRTSRELAAFRKKE